jgi:hypothetical protein
MIVMVEVRVFFLFSLSGCFFFWRRKMERDVEGTGEDYRRSFLFFFLILGVGMGE